MAPDVMQMLIDGQKAIFDEIRTLKDAVQSVAVQKNELDHLSRDMKETKDNVSDLDTRVTAIEACCIANHPKNKTIGQQVMNTVLMTAVGALTMAVFGFFGYIVVSNMSGYIASKQITKSGD